MVKRGPKPKGRVDRTWRPELAYAVGLITADGSLSKNGRHINFTSKDLDLIKVFQDCLELHDIKVGKKSSGYTNKKEYYQVQFGDVLFYQFLCGVGLHPNKSHTVAALSIPQDYFFDFVRGEWDGDGTIYRSQDKRWSNSYVISIAFASASYDFLSWLQLGINNKLGTSGFVKKGTRGFQLCYAKKDSQSLLAAMFYRTDVPHLPRKFAKAQEIYRIDALNSMN